jgi:uncharacterized protein YprB with RNaseH-like and TPR domain
MGNFDRFFGNGSGPSVKKNEQPETNRAEDIRGLPNGMWTSKSVYRTESLFEIGAPYGRNALSDPDGMDIMRRVGAHDRVVCLDLETTGLSGGAGTYAFLCGIGATNGGFFKVTQYFLKSPAYEAEWLATIDADIPADSTLVTYNGRTFDVPMLLTRHVMTRMNAHWEQFPHIDLLYFSRKFYKGRLESCSLGNIERRVLGLQRSGEDVQGYLIPGLYSQYLRSRDASDLRGVFYHNRLDIASLAALYCHIARTLEGKSKNSVDLLRAGDFWNDRGFTEDASRLWNMAEEYPASRMDAAIRKAFMAKKNHDHLAAKEHFESALQQLNAERGVMSRINDALVILEELAKLEEHRFMSPERALAYVRGALDAIRRARIYGGISNTSATRKMEHRKTRLEKKIGETEGMDHIEG